MIQQLKKNLHKPLPVAGPTGKELGSCHSHPHKKKAEETENQQLFLDLSENWSNRANQQPLKLERKVTTENESFPGSEAATGAREEHIKVIDKLLETEHGIAWERKTPRDSALGGTHTSVSYISKSLTRYAGWRLKKSSLLLLVEEGKSNYFEICSEHSVLINKELFSRETVLPYRNPHCFTWVLTNVEEGKYPFPATSSLPASLKGKKPVKHS